MIASDQTTSIEFQLGAMGMVVVSDLALAAGAASIPGPGTDAADDGWFVWVPFMAIADGITTGNTKNPQQYFEFDSKAMRRVEEGFGIAVMIENVHPTQGLQAGVALSMLTSLS